MHAGRQILLKDFEWRVLHSFDFMEQEGKLKPQPSHRSPGKYMVDFYSKRMLVRVSYGLKKKEIEVYLYRNPEKIRIIPRNYKETTTLEALSAYQRNIPAVYWDLMPEKIGLRDSLDELAILFKKCAWTVALGLEWISIDMVCHDHRVPCPKVRGCVEAIRGINI